jgi:hypothetical protein
MSGRDKYAGVLRPGVDTRDGGITWVDIGYDERLDDAVRRVNRPETLPNDPTVNRAELGEFMKARIAELTRQGVAKNPAYADEQAARKHFKDRSIPRGWVKEFRAEYGVPAEWKRPGRKPKQK